MHEFADIPRKLKLAFYSRLAEELLQRSADGETRAVRFESSETKGDDLGRIRFGRRVSNEDIAHVKGAERHQGHLIAARVQSLGLFEDLETSLGVCEEDPFELVTHAGGKGLDMHQGQKQQNKGGVVLHTGTKLVPTHSIYAIVVAAYWRNRMWGKA